MVRYQILHQGVFDLTTRTVVLPNTSSADWQAYETWLTAGNTPLPPDSIGQDDLATSKAKRQSEIDAYAAGLRNQFVRGRSVGEMASWTLKLIEARAWVATQDPLQAPMLVLSAQVRGITVDAMAAKVLAQAEPFLQAEAYVDGIRGKHSDAIDACTDVRDIITYDWLAGWPTV